MKTLSEKITSTKKGEKIWQQERAIFEVTELICELMAQQGVTRTKLAELLGTNKSYITQLLDGTSNMTLRTLSDVFVVLGRALHVTDAALSVSNVPPLQYRMFEGTVDWPLDAQSEAASQGILPDTESQQVAKTA